MAPVLNINTTGGFVGAVLLLAGAFLGVWGMRRRTTFSRPAGALLAAVVWSLILAGGVLTVISR